MRISVKAAAVLVVAGGLVGTGLPAGAFAATSAPSCVKRDVGLTGGTPNGAKVKLTNKCGSSKRLKVVWTNAHDSKCFTLGVGKSRTETSSIARPFSSYDKTVLC
jgi:hypothetical protein